MQYECDCSFQTLDKLYITLDRSKRSEIDNKSLDAIINNTAKCVKIRLFMQIRSTFNGNWIWFTNELQNRINRICTMSTNLLVVKKGYSQNTNGICIDADLIILKANQYWHMPTEMCTQIRCLCKRFMSISRSDATTFSPNCGRKV